MAGSNFHRRSLKRKSTSEPLVDHDAQGILIGGCTGMSLDLLRCHIRQRPGDLLGADTSTLEKKGDPKITEQDLVLPSDQHIFWLDIAMDHFGGMGIVECFRHLLDSRQYCYGSERLPSGIASSHGAMWGIGHDQVWHALLNIEIQQVYNMRMFQVR